MRNSRILFEWLRKADDDLSIARLVIKGKRKIVWSSCFHAQQSAEKYLKAYLIAKKAEPKKTHDLVELIQACSKFEASFTFLESICEFLNPFAIQTRYPDEINLDLHHAKKAIKAAEEIKKFVLNKIGLVKK